MSEETQDAPGTDAPSGGMWAKDELYAGTPLEQWTQPDVDFILHGAKIASRDFPLDNGDTATKTELYVSRAETPKNVVRVSTLSGAIAAKVEEAQPDDFPAVVQFQTVPASQSGWNDAKILKLVRRGNPDEKAEFNPADLVDGPRLDG